MRRLKPWRSAMDETEPLGIPLPIAGEPTRELWGLSWDEQVAAVLAWQAAGGDRPDLPDGWEAVRVRRIGRWIQNAGAPDVAASPGMEELMEVGIVLASLNERLLHLQTQVNEVVSAELARRRRPRVLAPPGGEGAEANSGGGLQAQANGIGMLIRSWFEAADSARLELAGLGWGGSVATPVGGAGAPAGAMERRRRAVLISFPDRRTAATA